MTNNNKTNYKKGLDELIIFPGFSGLIGDGVYNRCLEQGGATTQIATSDIEIYKAISENKFDKLIAYLPLFGDSPAYLTMIKNAILSTHENGGAVEISTYKGSTPLETVEKLNEYSISQLESFKDIGNKSDLEINNLVGTGRCHPLLSRENYKMCELDRNDIFKKNVEVYLDQFNETLFKKYLENNGLARSSSVIAGGNFILPDTDRVTFEDFTWGTTQPAVLVDGELKSFMCGKYDTRGDFVEDKISRRLF